MSNLTVKGREVLLDGKHYQLCASPEEATAYVDRINAACDKRAPEEAAPTLKAERDELLEALKGMIQDADAGFASDDLIPDDYKVDEHDEEEVRILLAGFEAGQDCFKNSFHLKQARALLSRIQARGVDVKV